MRYKYTPEIDVNWDSFFDRCAEKRDRSDDIYRIALLRVERMFRNCEADGLSTDKVNYERLANIIRGVRMADSQDQAYDALRESGIKLNPYEEGVMAVLNALDVTADMKFVIP